MFAGKGISSVCTLLLQKLKGLGHSIAWCFMASEASSSAASELSSSTASIPEGRLQD